MAMINLIGSSRKVKSSKITYVCSSPWLIFHIPILIYSLIRSWHLDTEVNYVVCTKKSEEDILRMFEKYKKCSGDYYYNSNDNTITSAGSSVCKIIHPDDNYKYIVYDNDSV